MARVDFSCWSDGQLLMEYASRFCEDAFAELHNRHHAALHRYLCRKFCFDDSRADDITQTVWLRVAEKCRDEIPRFVAWLRTVAANLARDLISLTDNRHAAIEDCDEAPLARESTPIEQAINNEEAAIIRSRVKSLDRVKRTAISCIYTHGMTIAETSCQLGMSERNVKRHLRMARHAIKCQIS